MKWFDNFILKAYRRARQKEDDQDCIVLEERPRRTGLRVNSHYGNEDAMNFKVYSARGGMIVECLVYDSKTDRETVKLHVIPDCDDLTQSLGNIITLEYLQR